MFSESEEALNITVSKMSLAYSSYNDCIKLERSKYTM